MKLLVVDDNEKTRSLIRAILRPYGHDVLESEDGVDAVRSYAVHRPDCVLMDIEMGPMDGIQATESIKRTYPDARIIILTMFDDPRLREAALRAGAEKYVLKENLIELPELL